MTEILNVSGLSVFYGAKAQAVEDVSFGVPGGAVVALLGANGAGKTSILKAVAGLIPARGRVRFDDADVSALPTRERVKRGIVYVPEGRQIVGNMTVRENLVLGGYHLEGRERQRRTEMVLDLFPEIANKADRSAWRLSGGEQQMLAIGRGLMPGPRLLLLDEPSLGLAPMLVRRVFDRLDKIREDTGLSMVLVEQNLAMTMRICTELYFLRGGMIVGHRDADQLRDKAARQDAIDAFLGAAA